MVYTHTQNTYADTCIYTMQIKENMLYNIRPYPSCRSLFFSHCFTRLSSALSSKLLTKIVRDQNKPFESMLLLTVTYREKGGGAKTCKTQNSSEERLL